jgi:hypothetical protein
VDGRAISTTIRHGSPSRPSSFRHFKQNVTAADPSLSQENPAAFSGSAWRSGPGFSTTSMRHINQARYNAPELRTRSKTKGDHVDWLNLPVTHRQLGDQPDHLKPHSGLPVASPLATQPRVSIRDVPGSYSVPRDHLPGQPVKLECRPHDTQTGRAANALSSAQRARKSNATKLPCGRKLRRPKREADRIQLRNPPVTLGDGPTIC